MYIDKLILREITDIPRVLSVVKSKLKNVEDIAYGLINENVNNTIFTGCGSSYYAALKSSYPFLLVESNSYTLPTSEVLWLVSRGSKWRFEKTALIVFSRSGETAEVTTLVKTLKNINKRRVIVVGITCNPNSSLTQISDYSLSMIECMEESVYMTKSFVALSLMGTLISMRILELMGYEAIGDINDVLEDLAKTSKNLISDLEIYDQITDRLHDKSPIIILGTEDLYSIALEAALKFIEVAYTSAIGLHALEFRHGYIGLMENPRSIVVVLSNNRRPSYASLLRLINELKALNRDVIHVSNSEKADYHLTVEGRSYVETIAYIIPLYYIAIVKSLKSGHDPDNPRYVSKVVSAF